MSNEPARTDTNAKVLVIVAPLSGVIVPLEDVPDPAFAQRLVGDGASIDPMSSTVLAPCDARVLQVHRANHAVTLLAQGLEIIIHVGLDTVMLKGEGFTALVKEDDIVRLGAPLLSFDADLVARKARSLLTQVVVTNVDAIASIERSEGIVTAGRDVLMRIVLAPSAAVSVSSTEAPAGDSLRSHPVVITTESGLHARPAAMITAAARRFTSDVRLVSGAKEANARSVVSIMSLEIAAGDAVTVVARGSDAAQAMAAIVELLASGGSDQGAHSPAPAAASAGAPAADPTTRAAAAPAPAVSTELRGVSASPGVAVGNVFQFRHDDAVSELHAADAQQERRILDAALVAARSQLHTLRSRMADDADTGRADIFRAHQELLEDPELLDAAAIGIRHGDSAAFAWKKAYTAQADRLLALKSQLIAGRAADLRDVGRRVLRLLVDGAAGGTSRPSAQEVPEGSIIVAEDLAPSDTASLDRTRVLGFCTTSGSATSHAAILARGLGIPAIAGIDPRALDLASGTRVILDADAGVMRLAPSAAQEAEIARRRASSDALRASELSVALRPALTTDGHRIEVVGNVGDAREGARVVEMGGEGVGLLRSEFLFMHRDARPSEDEQAESYSAVARALGPDRILVIRTLDVGGDKPLAYLPIGAELNPFLGERGVRFTLSRPDVMREQIRAILRASKVGKVALMFPMIATIAEWRAARAMVEAERAAMGVPVIPIGIMVETPAAAMIADQFAREASFLSIGTNDLTQYTLAMDRTNPALAPQVDALHPAVLRLIERTAAGAHGYGRWVGVCGALAGDLDAVPVLLGLGVDELSVDVPIIPAVKARVRGLSMALCREMAAEAVNAEDGAAVRAIVARFAGRKTGSAT
ncbi:MAG: phosphoenolpyruvate--protein phosphotransferase [Gemmatimonadaceae bacterium]|nr:phosphoenolpyruvate--protein phosphotransferase [Gemmatimonadaceae bacterium]